MLVVLSIGGSILAKGMDPDRFISYANVLKKLSSGHRLVVVTGGGAAARDYIDLARTVGANEVVCDFIGIDITRLNAQLLISALGDDAYPETPHTYREAETAFASGKIVVMGGVIPGQTTDAVSAILAEYLNADLMLVATSVDGVYSADPTTNPDAVRFDRMTVKELVNTVISTEMKAGSKSPVDPVAAKIIERCGIRTVVMDGSDPADVSDAIIQMAANTGPVTLVHTGTIIGFDE